MMRILLFMLLIAPLAVMGKAAYICGHITHPTADTIAIYGYQNQNEYIGIMQPLAETRLDAQGRFSLKLDIQHGIECVLREGDMGLTDPMYLEPGDSIVLGFEAEQTSIDGKGAEKVDFLMAFVDTFYVKPPLGPEYRKAYINMGLPDYVAYLDNRRKMQQDFFQQYFQHKAISQGFRDYVEAIIKYTYANNKLQYLWKHNYSLKIKGNIHPEPAYFQLPADIPMENPDALGTRAYYDFLQNYIDALGEYELDTVQAEKMHYYRARQYAIKFHIADSLLHGPYRQIAQAELLLHDLQLANMTNAEGRTQFDSLMSVWEKSSPPEEMRSIVRQEYNNTFFTKGSPAPAFTLSSLGNEKTKLSDFKGKVVLLDFWSTSCSPCIKEIPASNSLQQKLKGKDFVMVCVCLNSSEKDWRNTVKSKHWQGVQLFDQYGITRRLYDISGYPKYVLIDKKGNIYTTDALRPAEGVQGEIERLLAE